MFSIAFGSLSQHAIHRRPADAESGRNRARRFTAGVHPLRKSGFLCVEDFGPPNRLAACTTRLTGCRPMLAPQFQFKLSKTGQDARHHPAGRVSGVDPFAERTQHDPALAEFADGRHYLGGVPAQAVDADHDDGVSLTGIVQECG